VCWDSDYKVDVYVVKGFWFLSNELGIRVARYLIGLGVIGD
jgi:hypothetical protein